MARRKALLGSSSAVGELECPITLLGPKLDQDQAYAGRKAKATYARFAIALQPPRVVAGSMQDYVQGSGAAPPAEPGVIEEYLAEFEEMRRAVLREVKWRYRFNREIPDSPQPSAVARQAWREVHALMHGRMPRNLHALKLGLDAIVLHYDLGAEPEAAEPEQRAAA